MRQPGPCVRALCEAVAVFLSKKMICARSGAMQRQAKIFLTLPIVLFTPCTSRFILALFALNASSYLKSCELFTPHLSFFHLIISLFIYHLSKFFSIIFILSEHYQHTKAWNTDAFTLYTGKTSKKYLYITILISPILLYSNCFLIYN